MSASGLVTVEAETPHALDNALAAMLRDGCVVLAGAVSAERCDEAMEQLKPYSDDAGGGTVGSVLVRSEACWDFASHPLVLALCEAILGRQCLRLDDAATSARHRLLGAGFGFENGGRLQRIRIANFWASLGIFSAWQNHWAKCLSGGPPSTSGPARQRCKSLT